MNLTKGAPVPSFKKAQESLPNLSIPPEGSRRRGTFAFGQPFLNGGFQDDSPDLLLLGQRQIEFFGEPPGPVGFLNGAKLRPMRVFIRGISVSLRSTSSWEGAQAHRLADAALQNALGS